MDQKRLVLRAMHTFKPILQPTLQESVLPLLDLLVGTQLHNVNCKMHLPKMSFRVLQAPSDPGEHIECTQTHLVPQESQETHLEVSLKEIACQPILLTPWLGTQTPIVQVDS
jgi:hypothetical protein